jgi:signal peptidase I
MIRRGLLGSLLAVIAFLALRRRIDVVEVRGRSMAPALLPGDRLLVARFASPRAGDIVLAPDPRDPRRELVKRVSGIDAAGVVLGGDNSSESTDGRSFGALPLAAVSWRVIGRYWPPERIGQVASAPTLRESTEQGGEPACAFPEALIAGEPSLGG